jgi:hypothetical protein
VPNCLTVSAFDETALPVTRTADEFIRVGTAVPEFWLNVLIYSEQTLVCDGTRGVPLGRFVWGRVKTGSLVQKVHYGFSTLRLKGRINFKIEMKGLVGAVALEHPVFKLYQGVGWSSSSHGPL